MPHSGKDYIKAAKKNNLEVRKGKGDHMNVYGPAGRGYMTIPMHKELSRGVDSSANKWFKTLGIIVTIVLVIVVLLVLNNFAIAYGV